MRERLILIAGGLIAFGASIASGFHFDDYALLTDPLITSPSGWWKCWGWLQTRPLTWFTFWLNYQFGGTSPVGYHIVNVLLHLAVAIVLFEVLKASIPSGAAFLAATLFAVHPIQTEAVAYVFARGTLLNTLFCLLALRFWLRGRNWIAVAWFAAALLAKEECVTFPLVLFLLFLSTSRASIPLANARGSEKLILSRDREGAVVNSALWPIATMLLLALIAGARAVFATRMVPGAGAGFAAGITPVHYFLTQGIVILRYARLLVVPWGFTIDPDIRIDSTAIEAGAWLIVAAACALALRRFSRAREGFWLSAALILLIPSSSIFPAADLAADRRMYLPMIAFAPCFGLAVRNWRPWILALIGVVMLSLSVQLSQIWRSEESLWSEAAERAPAKIRPRLQLSRAVDPQKALPILQEAKRLAPDDPGVASELGRVWLQLERPAEALGEFGRALAMAPKDAHALNNRGVALRALGQDAAARRDFEQALTIDPCLEDARRNLNLPPCGR